MHLLGQVLFSVLVLLTSLKAAHADNIFDNLRVDQTIPAHCRETQKSFFKKQPQTITFGANGSTQKGFDYEHRISRDGARILWDLLARPDQFNEDAFRRAVEKEPTLTEDLELLKTYGPLMGADFEAEGEILEVLALLQLRTIYSQEEYYFTGGVAYHNVNSDRLIGELDLIVGHKSNCEIFVVGETKLGTHRLEKAKDQLRRFINFYRSGMRGWSPVPEQFDLFDWAN